MKIQMNYIADCKRNPIPDIMKGIGIMLMMIGHFISPGIFHDFIYSFHMPMFFILSGFYGNYTDENISWGG